MKVAQFPDYRKDNPYQQLLANALAKHGVEVLFPQGYRRGLPFSRALAGLPDVDVLHLHWLTPYLRGQSYPAKVAYALKLLVDLRLAKARGVRLVWTVHNIVSHETTVPNLEIWLTRRMVALVDALIVHSEGARLAVMEQFKVSAEKIAIIAHGDFADAYGEKVPRAEARQRLGIDLQLPVFLFFGMIRPYKGVEQLLEIWNKSPTVHQSALLVIAGDARDSVLANSITLAASSTPNVHLHMRYVANSEVPLFFGIADFVVLPFKRSLTSGTIALAQTFSIPIIAPRIEATRIPDLLPLAHLYDATDPCGLANALFGAISTFQEGGSPTRPPGNHPKAGWSELALSTLAVYQVMPKSGKS